MTINDVKQMISTVFYKYVEINPLINNVRYHSLTPRFGCKSNCCR